MAFPTSGLVDNQVHKEGNRSFVYDSTLLVWDQVPEAPETISILGVGKGLDDVTLGSSVVFPALHGIVGTSGCNVYPASATSCNNSAETKILFATEREDIADEFASNKFTVTVAGMYYIMVQVTLQDFTDGKAMQAKIMKNGTGIALHRVNPGRTDHASGSVSTIVTLAVNDYIEGYVWHNNSSSRNTTAADGDTNMVIMRLT